MDQVYRIAKEAAYDFFNAQWSSIFGEPALTAHGERADGSTRFILSPSATYVVASRRLADLMPLSKSDVAALLGCSEKHVDRLRQSKILPSGKDGSRVVFEAGAVKAYIRSFAEQGKSRRGR